jgi:hypothetical protein
MATRTYHGSCHCGAVRYEVDLDLAAGGARCNCSWCAKDRTWSAAVKPEAFRLLTDPAAMADYTFGSHSVHHTFCRTCGIHACGHGELEAMGGAFVTVALACLDDADTAALAEAPVAYADGRHDNWWNPPAETRHL